MNPPQKISTTVAKIVLLFSLGSVAAIFLINGTLPPSSAQSSTDRQLEDKVPKHLPIKVKLKKEKEKAFRDLKNEKWTRDFELEVTNTGNKQIYFLSLLIVLPEITAPDGNNMGFSLHYGRSKLGDIETKAEADDIPIKPGETHVFSLRALEVEGWERFRQRENKPDAKKLILKFQILSFGDGTGFWGNDGMAVPHASDARTGLGPCRPPPTLTDFGVVASQRPLRRYQPTNSYRDHRASKLGKH